MRSHLGRPKEPSSKGAEFRRATHGQTCGSINVHDHLGRLQYLAMELENTIATHPAVMEVAVFGIPDPRWGETPCAVVVPKSGRTIDVAEVVQLCAEQLGSYKKPGRVVVRDEPLPKTPVGKIKRRELREPFWAGHTRRVAGS